MPAVLKYMQRIFEYILYLLLLVKTVNSKIQLLNSLNHITCLPVIRTSQYNQKKFQAYLLLYNMI